MTRNLLIVSALIAQIFISHYVKAQGVWTQKANFGGGAISENRAFSIGNFGYFGGATTDLWQYDPVNDSWTQMAAFIGTIRFSAVGFSIGTSGYIGTGGSFNDFYEYDQTTNTWTQRASFIGSGREGALGIAINGKGYIGTGGGYLNDWWEYDPATDAWTQKANLAGPGRYHGGAFAVYNKGYICTGFNGSFYNDLWEYDPANNSWLAKASLPGITRDRPVGVATSSKGYILTGWTGSAPLNDAWEYDPLTDTWTSLPSMPTTGRYNSCGFAIANKIYIGTGYMSGTVPDFWEYGPDCSTLATSVSTSCVGICDGSASITFPDSASISSCLWSNLSTTISIQNLCAGTYTADVTDTAGCNSQVTITILEPDPITATAGITEPSCFGDTNGVLCALTNASPATFLWTGGATSNCIQNVAAGTYTVTVTDSLGCSGTIPLILTQPSEIQINFNPVDATCATCPNGSASAQITGGTGPFSYSWSTGSTLGFIFNQLPGTYSFCVTDNNNCSTCDSTIISFPSSIIDPVNSMYSLYPNPFNEKIILENNDLSNNIKSAILFDSYGREIFLTFELDRGNIIFKTSHLEQGVYFIKIITPKKTAIMKILKQK